MKKIKKLNTYSPPIAKLSSKHLLSIEGMHKSELLSIINRADYFADLDISSDAVSYR